MRQFLDKLLIIDGSYALHRSLAVKSLWELKTSTGVKTGGIFGVFRILLATMNKFPDYYPVFTWDKGLSLERLSIYPEYKNHTIKELQSRIRNLIDSESQVEKLIENDIELKCIVDKNKIDLKEFRKSMIENRKPKEEDFGYQYHSQRSMIIDILDKVGIPSFCIPGWEGDDLMFILSRLSHDNIIMTDDADLIQLINKDNRIYRPMHEELLEEKSYLEKNGYDSIREFIITKAIVGDGSDNISSVTSGLERKYAIGSVKAKVLSKIIYESQEIPEVYLPKIEELSQSKQVYKGFITNHDRFLRNMKLVDLLSNVTCSDDMKSDMTSKIISSYSNIRKFLEVVSKFQNYQINKFNVIDFNNQLTAIKKRRSFYEQ